MGENFAITLTDNCKTEDEWLAVMRFGMGQLLDRPLLLMECIGRRAQRMKEESPVSSKVVADFASELMGKLNLRFEMCDQPPPPSTSQGHWPQ